MIIVGQNRRIAHDLLTQALADSLHHQMRAEPVEIGQLELGMLVHDICDIAARDLLGIPIADDSAMKLRAFAVASVPDYRDRRRMWDAVQVWAAARMRAVEDMAGIGSIRGY